jgi:phage head maturation protease
MRLFFPIAKVNAEQRMVWGYASTEARDDQSEIVTRSALEAALGDYMKFANVREMHQLSAVGVAKEAAIDDKGLYVGAKIVDDRAWAKVVAGVYKGFSIGGRVTGRAASDPNTITALVLNEISLVDRPANPEAVFDCWKAAAAGEEENPDFCASYLATLGLTEAARKLGTLAQPVQVWACGEAAHRHLAKADAVHCIEQRGRGATAADEPSDRRTSQSGILSDPAVAASPADGGSVEYADPGYQPDGKKRYPIDAQEHIRAAWAYISRPENASRYTPAQLARIKSRIIARWKERIDRAGPPAASEPKASRGGTLRKAVFDVGRVASIICELGWLDGALAAEAALEGDDSPQPARLVAIIDELCDLLGAMVTEEAAEALDGTQEYELSPIASLPLHDRDTSAETEASEKAARNPIATALAQRPRSRAAGPGLQPGLAKMLAQQRAEKAALLQTLSEIGPRLDALSKRVDDLARQPLPPKTIAKPVIAISKTGDDFHPGAALDSGTIAAAFGRMSKEDQTLTLIKAARMNPIRRSDSAAALPRQP